MTSFKAPERCEEHPCDLDPCKHNGFCSRQGSQYDCLCKPGWSGDHCEVDVDECNGGVFVILSSMKTFSYFRVMYEVKLCQDYLNCYLLIRL